MGRSNIVTAQLQVGTVQTLVLTSVAEDPGSPGMYIIRCDGQLTRTDTGGGVSGKPIYAWTKAPGESWTRSALPVDTTDASGYYTVTLHTPVMGVWELQAEFEGDLEFAGC